jgi:hypothetical protein
MTDGRLYPEQQAQSDEQACSRDHDPRQEQGQADKQQKIG